MARARRSAGTAWQRRNRAARAKGYQSYYDYRAHDYGRLPPSAPRARGPALRRLRGHASAQDLRELLEAKRVELMNVITTVDAAGRERFEVLALLEDGSEREFTLTPANLGKVRSVIDDEDPDTVALVGSPRTVQRFISERRRPWTYTKRAPRIRR